jgi:hypothetical protein
MIPTSQPFIPRAKTMIRSLTLFVAIACFSSRVFCQEAQPPRVSIGPVIAMGNSLIGDNTIGISCPVHVFHPAGVTITAQMLLFRDGRAKPFQTLTQSWQGPEEEGESHGNILLFKYDRSDESKPGNCDVFLTSGFKTDKKSQAISEARGAKLPWNVKSGDHQWWQTLNHQDFPEGDEIVVGMFGTSQAAGKLRTVDDLKQAAAEGSVILACVLKWNVSSSTNKVTP